MSLSLESPVNVIYARDVEVPSCKRDEDLYENNAMNRGAQTNSVERGIERGPLLPGNDFVRTFPIRYSGSMKGKNRKPRRFEVRDVSEEPKLIHHDPSNHLALEETPLQCSRRTERKGRFTIIDLDPGSPKPPGIPSTTLVEDNPPEHGPTISKSYSEKTTRQLKSRQSSKSTGDIKDDAIIHCFVDMGAAANMEHDLLNSETCRKKSFLSGESPSMISPHKGKKLDVSMIDKQLSSLAEQQQMTQKLLKQIVDLQYQQTLEPTTISNGIALDNSTNSSDRNGSTRPLVPALPQGQYEVLYLTMSNLQKKVDCLLALNKSLEDRNKYLENRCKNLETRCTQESRASNNLRIQLDTLAEYTESLLTENEEQFNEFNFHHPVMNGTETDVILPTCTMAQQPPGGVMTNTPNKPRPAPTESNSSSSTTTTTATPLSRSTTPLRRSTTPLRSSSTTTTTDTHTDQTLDEMLRSQTEKMTLTSRPKTKSPDLPFTFPTQPRRLNSAQPQPSSTVQTSLQQFNAMQKTLPVQGVAMYPTSQNNVNTSMNYQSMMQQNNLNGSHYRDGKRSNSLSEYDKHVPVAYSQQSHSTGSMWNNSHLMPGMQNHQSSSPLIPLRTIQLQQQNPLDSSKQQQPQLQQQQQHAQPQQQQKGGIQSSGQWQIPLDSTHSW